MSVYYPSGCGTVTLPAHTCSSCPTYEFGRIRGVAAFKKSSPFTDITNPNEWDTKLAAGDAWVIVATQGAYDGGTTTDLPGFGDLEFISGGKSHVLNFKDPGIEDNCDFYNALPYQTDYHFVFRTSSKIWLVDAPVSFTPKLVVTDDLKSVMSYDTTVKWSDPDLPCPYNIPAGIFNRCYIPIVA